MRIDARAILSKLKRLRESDRGCELFGAAEHRYQLAGVASERTVRAFETRYGLTLPEDYRSFLLEVGNGGAGPCYGLLPFASFGTYKVGDLREQFPHTVAWNMPEGWFKNLPDPWDGEGEQLPTSWPSIEAMLDAVGALPVNEDAARRRKELESWYFSSEHVNGALPICHEGCGYYDLLVVQGAAYGSVWIDGRASDQGLAPVLSESGEPLSFGTWYMNWLQDCISQCATE